jgi:hypothetical protein
VQLDLEDLRAAFGFGVAGNFAGHLEQAGEAGDFVSVDAPDEAPKGIFPWYVPREAGFLRAFPLAHERIVLPASKTPLNLQIEPEVALVGIVGYRRDGTVDSITPRAIGAFNDCSIRREGATKISQKKNWGLSSKGIARTLLRVTEIEPDGATAHHRLASFLVRDGEAQAYGVDSPLSGYSYYGTQLLDWIVDRLRHQEGADDTPLENVGQLLLNCGRPAVVVIGIGATRYTDLGESTFLKPGDQSVVVVYDGARQDADAVQAAVAAGTEADLTGASVLRQSVVASA